MAKKPIWTAKNKPKLNPKQIEARFGAGTSLVRMGDGRYTIKGWKPATQPQRGGGGGGGGRPPGGTVVNQDVAPREWVGSEILGPWRSEGPPRLDPDRFEWMQNEHGRWFARPRTELTDLTTQQRADIQRNDQIANTSQAGIAANWGQAAQASEQNRAATAAELTALTQGLGGAQPGDPTSQALAENARAGATPGTAAIIAGLGRQPDVMREVGQTSAAQFRSAYDANRAETIASYRNAQQEAAAKAREQNLDYMLKVLGINTDLARTTLTAESTLAAAGLSQEGQNQRAILDARTERGLAQLKYRNEASERAQKLNIEAAKIERDLAIAQQNNQTKRAIALEKQAAAKRAAAKKARADAARRNKENLGKWTEQATKLFNGVRGTGPDGKPALITYSVDEIIRILRNRGATQAQARAIAYGVSGRDAPPLLDIGRDVPRFFTGGL